MQPFKIAMKLFYATISVASLGTRERDFLFKSIVFKVFDSFFYAQY